MAAVVEHFKINVFIRECTCDVGPENLSKERVLNELPLPSLSLRAVIMSSEPWQAFWSLLPTIHVA